MSITRSRRRVPRKRNAACGPDNMTGGRSAEEQNLSQSVAAAAPTLRNFDQAGNLQPVQE
jgi:hypothetical protein